MPRAADPAVRERILAAATDLLAAEGPQALSTRRLATEAGTSTMAVYTYFGGMDDLRRELRRDGFARLGAALDAAPATDDPVADLAAAVATYVALGAAHPARYRVLLVDLPPRHDERAGAGVHERFAALIDRCAAAGRFSRHEPGITAMWAGEVWLAAHGIVHLTQVGLLPEEPRRHLLADMLQRLAIGFGDRPERAAASVGSGVAATATPA